jgi:glucose/arabinose dehydrogenase
MSGVLTAFCIVAIAACSTSSPSDSTAGVSPIVATVVVDGLDRPTQFVDGPDGTLVVAQLAGDEGAADGQVIVVDPETGSSRVLLDRLDKPTGVLWADGVLWVMVRRGLVRAAWAGGSADVGPVATVLADLPFNGRSEGTLTALGDGRFLYETSGTLDGGVPAEGSGALWIFDPIDGSSTALATGLKNAYAHATLSDGRIVTTDVGDAADPPVDELNVIDAEPVAGTAADLGWPDCAGDADCPGVVRPLATFASSSTPTGVAVVGDDVYVTLFVTGELLRIALDGWQPGDEPVTPAPIIDDLNGPHTVLARPDGSLWISEHLSGRIVSIMPG